MKTVTWLAVPLLLVAMSIGVAGENANPDATMTYTLMQEDLGQFKTDFNEAVDQVRLVFIVGPT